MKKQLAMCGLIAVLLSLMLIMPANASNGGGGHLWFYFLKTLQV